MITAAPPATFAPAGKYNLGYVWLISVVAAMGGLLFGWDWVVIGGAKPFFQRYFEITSETQIGWANSCALVGCLVGALVAGGLSDKFGRKRLLIVAALIFAVTSLGNALANDFTIFIAWRIFGGVAIGLATPPKMRQAMKIVKSLASALPSEVTAKISAATIKSRLRPNLSLN